MRAKAGMHAVVWCLKSSLPDILAPPPLHRRDALPPRVRFRHYTTRPIPYLFQLERRVAEDQILFSSPISANQKPYIVPADRTKWGKERGKATVRLVRTGDERRWTLNATTWDRLLDAFGEDSDQPTNASTLSPIRALQKSSIFRGSHPKQGFKENCHSYQLRMKSTN